MANTQNRRVICERLLHHLSTATDSHMKVNIISKVIHLADKFSDDKNWFIATVNRAIVLGGQSSVPPGVCEKILDILPRGEEFNWFVTIGKLWKGQTFSLPGMSIWWTSVMISHWKKKRRERLQNVIDLKKKTADVPWTKCWLEMFGGFW